MKNSRLSVSTRAVNLRTLRRNSCRVALAAAAFVALAAVPASAALSHDTGMGAGADMAAVALPDAPATAPATVAVPSAANIAGRTKACTFEERQALHAYSARIAQAGSVAEARELAGKPTNMARRALGIATWVAPGADSLAAAKQRLERFEDQIAMASTPRDVADRFDALLGSSDTGVEANAPMQLADMEVGNAQVQGPGGCHYSTGEIVAIVIGFILFIIPGIILLVVLC